jgi:hypothetical protein
MAPINKDTLHSMLKEGFFDTEKDVKQVVQRLSQKGFTITGKKIGLVSQLLTFLCQDSSTGLERFELPTSEWSERGKWVYKKVR